jgi:NAD(P)H-hydrate epimerase
MLPLVGAGEMALQDALVQESLGVPGSVLMESAGRSVGEFILTTLDPAEVTVLVGPGNNGGDGYAVARYLLSWNIPVKVYAAEPKSQLAIMQRRLFTRSGGKVFPLKDIFAVESMDVAVDALFGVGLKRPLDGIYADVVSYMSEVSARVKVAVDMPSGLSADTGMPMGSVFPADYTITFGLPKLGLFLEPGFMFSGKIRVDSIGVPLSVWLSSISVKHWAVVKEDVQVALASLTSPSHKGEAGRLLIVGGGDIYSGAPLMAALGAIAMRTGLIYVAVPDKIKPYVAGKYPELIVMGWNEFDTALLERVDAIVIGPGMVQLPPFIDNILDVPVPRVVDASAIRRDILIGMKGSYVITPHPGEAARLLGTDVEKVKNNRLRTTLELLNYAPALVLKGRRTITASGSVRWINTSGNELLAVGGSGDVLSGMIGGLIARGLDVATASWAGVYIHGWWADYMKDNGGMLLPHKVIDIDFFTELFKRSS